MTDRQHSEILDKIEKLTTENKEIKDALLGTFDEKGFISRLRGVERVMAVQGGIVLAGITALIHNLITGIVG